MQRWRNGMRKKTVIVCLIFVFALAGAVGSRQSFCEAAKKPQALHVEGTRIVNASGKTVTLKGVSTHGIALRSTAMMAPVTANRCTVKWTRV